jgi:hypothetical protein
VWGVTAGDVNGDGRDDIVVLLDASDYQAQIDTYLNDGNGQSFTLVSSDSTASGFFTAPVLGDMDGDTRPDLMSVDFNESRVACWWKGISGGMFADALEIEAGRFPGNRPLAVNLSGDETWDMVYVEPAGDLVAIIRGRLDKPPVLDQEVEVYTGPSDVSALLIDDDSHLDLVVSHRDPAQVAIVMSRSAGTAYQILPDPLELPEGRGVSAALDDMDGDGLLDLVAAGAGGLAVSPGFPKLEMGLALDPISPLDVRDLAVRDADADGVPDVILFDRTEPPLGRAMVIFNRP